MKQPVLLLLTLSLCAAVPGEYTLAQDRGHATETNAEVPALTSFHTVVYRLWHTAWPNKDYEMMAALLPEIENGVAAIATADLPGILRDKKSVWSENVKKLQEITAAYKDAVEQDDRQKLLEEGEQLHSQFERLVRTVRPVLKEVEEFHTGLYVMYHYYMPADNIDSIRSAVPALARKMEALNKAQLPERLKKKEADFTAARTVLSASVHTLTGAAGTNDGKRIRDAIQSVHSAYQALEKVFE